MSATVYAWRSGDHPPDPAVSLRQTLAGKHLVVTGATGFVGKVWLALVLDKLPGVRRITVLARPIKGQQPAERVQHHLERSPALRAWRQQTTTDVASLLGDKLQVLQAKVDEPGLGLGRAALAELRGADALLNFSGLTDFEADPAQALAVNVHGALHAAALAQQLGNLPMLHISTTFVAGMRNGRFSEQLEIGLAPTGQRFSPEEELRQLQLLCEQHGCRSERIAAANARAKQLGWPNIYTYTKGLAEHLLRQRHGDAVLLVRPSIVESALHYPFPGWNEGVNTSAPLVWLLSTAFRRFPARRAHRFDVVPVDAVARGICLVLAAALRGERHAVTHLASSDCNPLSFERAVDLTALGVRRLHAAPEARWWQRHLLRHLDAWPTDRPQALLDVAVQHRWVQALRERLRQAALAPHLPAALAKRNAVVRFDRSLQEAANRLRKLERTLGRMRDLLRVYKPFIHDTDQTFCTDVVRQLSATLPADEQADFAFDVPGIDWYRYWLDVQIPGLAQWSLPQLRGERAPQDPPPPRRLLGTPKPKALPPLADGPCEAVQAG